MRDAFASFCGALFNRELRDVTTHELRQAGALDASAQVPANAESRVGLILKLPSPALLRLIYRFQFLSPLNTYAAVRSYVDNAPRKTQFIDEFVQNAEDAGAKSCRFEFFDDHVVVANDGRAFSPANLYALCSFRESDKANKDLKRQIGKFGVGFKSVFRVCRRPIVVTWQPGWPEPIAFRFFVPGACDEKFHGELRKQFDLAYPPQVPERDWDQMHTQIGYVFPVPTELSGAVKAACDTMRRNHREGSLFFLQLEKDLLRPQEYDRIIHGVRPECFTFLNLKALEVSDQRSGQRHSHEFNKSPLKDGPGGKIELLEVAEIDTRTDRTNSQRVLRRVFQDIPVPVNELDRLDQQARDALPASVRIAFVVPLDADGTLSEPVSDPRNRIGQLFAGLPITGERTGINYHVDAPFNLTADRDNILDDGFNEWLIEQIAEAASKLLIETRNARALWGQLYRFLPSPFDFKNNSVVGPNGLNPLFKPIHGSTACYGERVRGSTCTGRRRTVEGFRSSRPRFWQCPSRRESSPSETVWGMVVGTVPGDGAEAGRHYDPVLRRPGRFAHP